ncbi:hypothetical protein [Evansella clarkii]|uniref:hypothetical protein n=1 Tax=Evansella clarkii TaxID=79879 RepID=UPI0009983D7A|nr:hypothetical protein [Evansella clarkii]
MLTTERHTLKSLQKMIDGLPDNLTDRDNRFIIVATNGAISALIDAEEPINKTHRYHEEAKRIIKDLQAFMEYRHQEKWTADTTYAYHRVNTTTENRKLEA